MPCRRALVSALALLLANTASAPAQAQSAAVAPGPALSAEMAQLLAAARMWEAKGRADLAREVLEKALLLDPRQPDALQLLGLIEIRSNRPAQAELILRQMRQGNPDNPATRGLEDSYRIATRDKPEMARIRLLARSGKSDEASARLQALFPRGAPSGELAGEYYRILAGTSAGRLQAIAALRLATRQDPGDTRLARVLGSLLTEREATRQEGLGILHGVAQRPDADRKTALEAWRRALNNVRDDPAYYRAFELYLKEVPDDQVAQATLATLAEKLDAHRRMLADPAYQARQRGLAQLERGNLIEAENALQDAYRTRAGDAVLIGALGLVRMRQGRHDEARELFARALRLDPEQGGKWRGLLATAAFWGSVARARDANAQGRPAEAEAIVRRALAQQPENPGAQLVLADALMAQQKLPEAEALLRHQLSAREPDLGALRRLATLLRDNQRNEEIAPLIAGTEKRLTGAQAELNALRADMLATQADQLLAQRKNSPAMARLEEAIRLKPDSPWSRFTLARIYRDLGLPALGRSVLDDGLLVSQAPEMRYANALFRNSLEDIDGASEVLAPILQGERSEGMLRLAGSLAAQQRLRDARQLIARGYEPQARVLLQRATLAAAADPQMLATIGREWIGLREPDVGLRLVQDWLAAHPEDPAIGVRLRYGELLAAAQRDRELAAWLDDAGTRPGLSQDDRAAFEGQRLRLALREADRLIAQGELAHAQQALLAVPARQQEDRRWLLTLADLRDAQGDYAAAAKAASTVLASQPQDAGARLTLARMLEREGKLDAATDLVRAVLADAPEEDIDTRLSVARRLTALRREDEAAAVADLLRRRYPERSDITVQQGRIAQARDAYDEAAALYRESQAQEQRASVLPGPDGTPAEHALRALEARRQGQFATATLASQKAGDPGISKLDAIEIPLYLRMPHGYSGHAFLQADTVLLDAGTLPADRFADVTTFGQIAARGNANLLPAAQHERGMALAAGYESDRAYDSWRADIGTTPLGFVRQSVAAGLRYRAELGNASASVDVSRRAVTSSLISYAGATDPATGQTWGGVLRNGINLHYAQGVGRGSVFADLGAGLLTGHNVMTNRELTLRTGIDWPLFEQSGQRVKSGLVANYWHYAENLRFYSFGHGGYYSPQRYLSLGVPLDWAGRRGPWSWQLQGLLGWSNTYEKDMPYYPTRPDLQASAVARLASNQLAPPVYAGGSGGGLSYAFGGAVEYDFSPYLVAGLRFQIDRSRNYAPNRAMAYLRYYFSRQEGRAFPPTPVRPYSAY